MKYSTLFVPSPSNETIQGPLCYSASLSCFRIPLLDPNELAAKGATLLHHLALWMIEEKKSKDNEEAGKNQTQPSISGNHHGHRASDACDRPDSGFDSKDEDESGKNATGNQHQRHVSDTISEETSGVVTLHHTISEEDKCRTPSDASSSSSPDNVTEISRQAPIRQPIFRKRRIHMN